MSGAAGDESSSRSRSPDREEPEGSAAEEVEEEEEDGSLDFDELSGSGGPFSHLDSDDSLWAFQEENLSDSEYEIWSDPEDDSFLISDEGGESSLEESEMDDDEDRQSSGDDEVEIIEPGTEENADGDGDVSGEDEPELAEGEGDSPNEEERNQRVAEAEDLEPPRKVAKLDPGVDPQPQPSTSSAAVANFDEQGDGNMCSICYETFTNSGEHRISCLKCGHVFGRSCIEKWLRLHGRCPQCNCKARRGEIRILYVKSLSAVDTTELTEAKQELERTQITLSKATLENSKLKLSVESLQQQLKIMHNEHKALTRKAEMTVSSQSIRNFAEDINNEPATVPADPTARKQLRLKFIKYCEIREGECRAGAYNEFLNLLIVSHDMRSPLYPSGCCGIKQFNMLELRPTISTPLHQKQIRDMQFSLAQNNVVLTVGLDKKAILFNCNGNVSVQSFQTEWPLWSCAWDEVQKHIFYVGCSNGNIISYDIRFPRDVLATYPSTQDRSPVCRLKYVSPSYQQGQSNFPLSGLIVQQLNSVKFAEYRAGAGDHNSDYRFHPLPVDGPFFNVDFEPATRHILLSVKPSVRSESNHGSHLLCDLNQYYSDALDRNVVTTNTIRRFVGSQRDGQKISRSSLFCPEDGYVFAFANGAPSTVKYWDISQSESNPSVINSAPDYVLDYVHGRVNSNHFLALISERGVGLYNRTLS